MSDGSLARAAFAAAACVLAGLAVAPAHAQFMTGGYPAVIIPPPPAQSVIIPRRPKPQSNPPAETPPDAPPQVTCEYHGQTRVCQ